MTDPHGGDPGATEARDQSERAPDVESPHSELERIVDRARPGRLLVRMLVLVFFLSLAGAGAWLGRRELQERAAKGARMMHVPGGRVRIGNARGPREERPEHEVELRAFDIDATEVTVAAYSVCVREHRCTAPLKGDFCNWGKENVDEHPVNCVDHEQAIRYCDWAGKRLPTEREWEYAARGTDQRKFPWGNDRPISKRLNVCGSECRLYGAQRGRAWEAMYDYDDGWPITAPVGSYPDGQSPFGVLDMAGNVSEWTSSPYCAYPDERCGNETEFVIRGSGWGNHYEMNVEVTTRSALAKTEALEALGFRCAKGGV